MTSAPNITSTTADPITCPTCDRLLGRRLEIKLPAAPAAIEVHCVKPGARFPEHVLRWQDDSSAQPQSRRLQLGAQE